MPRGYDCLALSHRRERSTTIEHDHDRRSSRCVAERTEYPAPNSDAAGRERTRNVRFSRTLAVTPGHSKAGDEQARCPLTRSDEITQAAVRFPPAPQHISAGHGLFER